jgi:hypothetical protein
MAPIQTPAEGGHSVEVRAERSAAGRLPAIETWRVLLRPNVFVALGYLAFAAFLTSKFWSHIQERMVAVPGDQMFFMYALRHGANVVTKGVNPFFTEQINAPEGINMMANTSSLALTIPMTPVTLLFGPRVSFAVLLILGLAGTAYAWNLVFRRLVSWWQAAALGGAFCGFAPAMISHANGHINWTAQFIVPMIVLAALRLAEPGRHIARGAVLGLLVVLQAFINEEVLLHTAMGVAGFMFSYAAFAWWGGSGREMLTSAGNVLRGLVVTAPVAGVLLAYPLYAQFRGPQSYSGLPADPDLLGADLASYWLFSTRSLASSHPMFPIALNYSEESTFYGWPLLLLMAIAIATLWRRVLVRALALTAVVFIILSLGTNLSVLGHRPGVPLPWRLANQVPLLDTMLTTRLGMVLIPIFGVLLALIAEHVRTLQGQGRYRLLRPLAYAAIGAALVPILPTPLETTTQPITPAFVTSGAWKPYVPAGYALVPVPDHSPFIALAQMWLADSGAGFAVTGGYFLGPGSTGYGTYGADPVRPTQALLRTVADSGVAPTVTDAMRAELRADVNYWHASVLMVPDTAVAAETLRPFLDELVGVTGTRVLDATVWSVRDLVVE